LKPCLWKGVKPGKLNLQLNEQLNNCHQYLSGANSVSDRTNSDSALMKKVDFYLSVGDNLSFGLTDAARNAWNINTSVNKCSGAYGAGQWAGTGLSLAIGVAGGIEAAGAKGAGMEFSHWIPNRLGGPRSIWNGNFVSSTTHYLQDPFRFPPGWQDLGPKWNPLLQQLSRIPNALTGTALGATYGLQSQGVNRAHACGCP
jgi:hypothetical protein